MTTRNLFSILIIFLTAFAAVAFNGAVEIQMKTKSSLFFDQKVLQEIIDSSEQESTEAISQKLNDFFSSSPLSIQSDGQFFIQDFSGKKQDVILNPRSARHAH